jgi:HK97 gp10 family phage protein
MKITFSIRGAREMERVLFELGPIVSRKLARPAVVAGARIMAEDAKSRVRVRTGELRASITAQAAPRQGEERITAHLGFFKPTSRRGHLTEFGTRHSRAFPFMQPAMEAKAEAALEEMGRILARGIEREANKLAKK